MADLFVERLTGQAAATAVPVEIQLVMTPDSLLGSSEQPARIGAEVLPAATARDLAGQPNAPTWLRRVFIDPQTGSPTGADPRRRRFNEDDARFIRLRDQHCRHPRCDAAISDLDHLHRYADGGATTRANGQGVCEAHNLVKEMPGWHSSGQRSPDGPHTVYGHHPHRAHLSFAGAAGAGPRTLSVADAGRIPSGH